MSQQTSRQWFPENWVDYELIDAGHGKRLERFGDLVLQRPDVTVEQAPMLPAQDWYRLTQSTFRETTRTKGEWSPGGAAPKDWHISYPIQVGRGAKATEKQIKFALELTQFKHVGVFPEQAANWEWIAKRVWPGKRVLNLFAYTGGASLAARATGAEVTHVDSVKQVVSWTRRNMELSGQEGIRWCIEDAMKFVERENRRGNTYDMIIMDPPAFGLGPKGERWRLESRISDLIDSTAALLESGGHIVMNTYAGFSPDILEGMWRYALRESEIECGHLCLKARSGRVVTTGSLLRLHLPK